MSAEDSVRDVTRESLIALSYLSPNKLSISPDKFPASPDKFPASLDSSKKVTSVGNTVTEKDGSVDYWSELISLSYPTPDAESVPQVKG